jgi:ABC-2 type transport system permease protein
VKLLWHQIRTEQLVFWRSREAAFFIFIFPLLLFLLLGAVYHGRYQGEPIKWAVIAGLVAYGCANTAFAGLAIQLVLRRESGILKRLRATPLPPALYVTTLLVSTLIVFVLQAAALFLLGRVLQSTPLPGSNIGALAVVVVFGAAAFAALGVAISSVIRSGDGSSAVVNFVLLPMAFLTGSFGPTRHYPAVLRAIGDVLPLKYFIQIVDAVYLHGESLSSKPEAFAILGAWGVFGVVFASRRFRWEPQEG